MSASVSRLSRLAAIGGVTALAVLAVAGPAAAHVTANPSTAVQGSYTKVSFRVPNEMDNANTTQLEINLPLDHPIASVSVRPSPGWIVTVSESKLPTPIKNDDGEVTKAVSKIVWSKGAIAPGQFQEFDVSLGPLPQVPQVVFKALQTYSDGNVVRWIDEPTTDGTEPEKPAPALKLTAAAAADAPAAATSSTAPTVSAAGEAEPDGNGTWAGIVGIVLGLAALVLGLLAYRRSGQSTAGQ